MNGDDARAALALGAAAFQLRVSYDELSARAERIILQRDQLELKLDVVRQERNSLEAILRRLVAALDADVQLSQEVDRCVALEIDPADPDLEALGQRLTVHQAEVSAARAEALRAIEGGR